MAGFYIKDSQMNKIAKELAMEIIRKDSWANYRSHWIFSKTGKPEKVLT